jgi:THO complex subunit 2
MLSSHLADTSRHKLQNDGINIAHWFQHLSHFTGVYYRAFPQTELQALIEFLMLRLEDGDSLYLLVFNELLARMGGCEVLEDLSDAQIGGLAGGETLRREMLAFSKASKRAVSKLQEALCTPSTAIPILALVAQRHFGVNKVCLCRSCEFLQAARVQSLQREGKSCKAAWATL